VEPDGESHLEVRRRGAKILLQSLHTVGREALYLSPLQDFRDRPKVAIFDLFALERECPIIRAGVDPSPDRTEVIFKEAISVRQEKDNLNSQLLL
jgi:hypothetical protein